ncbi:PREDICTED: uncharacterized protein LOC104817313 isoform X1 [Tarenaya hassleriana]|uniref:uncharacterized protein LOC104817313 isoform X1 n=1 Tax=Tarenaya hassleriana TaxID=28532 RepID=UPI00053C7B60|nr:PREDICTED: uncharacterized protein LOC104817313 isoform X1 [Tarenaya hassleriana]
MVTALSINPFVAGPKALAGQTRLRPSRGNDAAGVRCSGGNSETSKESEPENALLKMAWYGSELLGMAASALRPAARRGAEEPRHRCEMVVDCSGRVVRVAVVDAIKQDFKRSYFVTGKVMSRDLCVVRIRHGRRREDEYFWLIDPGDMTTGVYEEDCEFADPAGSFRGVRRFKRNCGNFGALIDRSNMKLMKWEDFDERGVGHWRFSCVMSFPWKPILSATGYTEYYYDAESGKISRHVEHWNVPKTALFKQLLRPSRGRKARP